MLNRSKDLYKIGVDVGGTFTDIVIYDESNSKLFEEKLLTTNVNPQEGIISGIKKIINRHKIEINDLTNCDLIHGTTLFTNSLISRTENPPGLITTSGAADIIYTGKGNRYDPYDRELIKPEVLVPKYLRCEIDERTLSTGEIYKKINFSQLRNSLQYLKDKKVKSVAIVLLHSYKNNKNEKLIKKYILENKYGFKVSLSSEICPVIGEYDRLNTTCANAYIQPIAENYLLDLKKEINNLGIKGKIQMIWSDGGISSINDSIRNPIRLLESGPAGGALAISYLSKKDKKKKSLAFDMGGTTAKICLINDFMPRRMPSFEFGRIHRNKPGSGIKINVPCIDMLEIGAGGGSIAQIDSLGLIKVGPKSAGAIPGPISYGQGGKEITVTDINLLLGYLSDEALLAGHLKLNKTDLIKSVKEYSKNNNYDYFDLITGIRKIVTENMAQAIKLHVTEKGEDPRDYVLNAFGGAGPLHAYDIAKYLGIKKIIIPNRAGILSSYGFLISNIGIEKNYSFIHKLEQIDDSQIKIKIENCKKDILRHLKYSKITESNIKIEVFLEMRYEGQGFDIPVKIKDNINKNFLKSRFNTYYKNKYGINLNFEVEINFIKVVASIKNKSELNLKNYKNNLPKRSFVKRKVWCSEINDWVLCKVIKFEALQIDKQYKGPVVIENNNTTVVVGSSGFYKKNINGDILIKIVSKDNNIGRLDFRDPINLEILLSRIRSIADEADSVLLKTSFSSAVRDGKDYSLVISDKNGKCIGMPTECMPLFITCMPRTIKIISKTFKKTDLIQGDVIITNDPWIGSGHKSDVALIAPIILNSELLGYIGTILHVADIGGTLGEFRAWDIYEEGLILPPVKIVSGGKINNELIELIKNNVRLPKLVIGDIYAMFSSINIVRTNLSTLYKNFHNLDFSKLANAYQNRMIKAYKSNLKELPKGSFSGEIVADGILHGSKEMAKPIKLKVKISISEDKIIVDYRGSDKQRERQPINVPYSYTMSDTFYALQYILFDNIQNIGTQYCPVEIILDEKSILNASKPVPVFARCRTGLHISALLNFTLQKVVPNKVLAGCGHNIIFRAAGNDENGNYFAMTFMPKGGMGATGTNDGFDCTVYPTNCTMIQTEIAETRAPIVVERNLATNTAGKGKYRGGAGQIVKITSISEQPLQFSFRPNFIQNPPLGLNDGKNGKNAEILINGKKVLTDPVIINKNEYVTVRTAGGGGLGKYSERSDLNKIKDEVDGIYS